MKTFTLLLIALFGLSFPPSFGDEITVPNGKDGLNIYWDVKKDEASGNWQVFIRFENTNAYQIQVRYQKITFTMADSTQENRGQSFFCIEPKENYVEEDYSFKERPTSITFGFLSVVIPLSI